jgi:hypothetical protein
MSNQAGSKLKRAVKEFAEGLGAAPSVPKEQKQFLQLNLVPVLSMFAEHFTEQDEVVGEIGAAVEDIEKVLEDEGADAGESGIEPELADRLLAHLRAFAGLLETSKAVWSMPESQMAPEMLAGKERALADIAALEAENAALLGAVKEARIDEDNPVVSLVKDQPEAAEEDDDDDDDAGDDDGAA